MYGWEKERDLPNYAINLRISFIVHPCLLYLLQLMEGKSVSLCDFWKTSTNWHSPWLVSCGCNHPRTFQNIPPTIESKKAKPIVVVYWICLCEQEPSPASMAPVSEAGESSKAYKRSHKETINQIPNHHTWSFTGRVGPQARLGSPSSALPARPPSSPSPTEAISSTSHASYGKFNQHDEVLSKDF